MNFKKIVLVLLSAFSFAYSTAWTQENKNLPEWKQALFPADTAWKSVPQVFAFGSMNVETMDPQRCSTLYEFNFVNSLFEGLVSFHPETMEIVPAIAESWKYSNGGKTLTLQLRENAKWSDGTVITAHDFYRSYRYILNPRSGGSPYTPFLYYIQGAEEFKNQTPDRPEDFQEKTEFELDADNPYGKLSFSKSVGVKVVDDFTLQIDLKNPCPYFLNLLAYPIYFPVPLDRIQTFGDHWTRQENILTNGPFHLKDQIDHRIIFEKSKTYWDKDIVRLEKIVVHTLLNDPNTAFQVYKQYNDKKSDEESPLETTSEDEDESQYVDTLHWTCIVPLAKIDELNFRPDFYAVSSLAVGYLSFNIEMSPFDDVRVRQALALALDRSIITKDITRDGSIPTSAFTPAHCGYEPPVGLEPNFRKARELLAEAGYPEGKDFPITDTLNLYFITNENLRKIVENIQQQWKQHLGIEIPLRNVEGKVFFNERDHKQYCLSYAGWGADYSDPNTFLDLWTSFNDQNVTNWSRPAYDALIRQAAFETDQKRRFKLFEMAEELVLKEAPIIPIMFPAQEGLIAENVRNFFPNPLSMHFFKYVYLEPREE